VLQAVGGPEAKLQGKIPRQALNTGEQFEELFFVAVF